jgi:hypothetical protein
VVPFTAEKKGGSEVASSSLPSSTNSGSHRDLQAKEITQTVYLYYDFILKKKSNIDLKRKLTTERVESNFFYSL